jgi:adenylate kinase
MVLPDIAIMPGVAVPVKTRRPLAMVLFGSPGSGKGTQSKFLVRWLGIPQISTGDMLREHVRTGTVIGKAIEARMKAGSLVPDQLVNGLVFERIRQPDCERGFILDGYPRTPEQAAELLRVLTDTDMTEVVIHLVLYNAISNRPAKEGICDLDGAALVVRDDDRPEVVRARLDEYEALTRPVIESFRLAGVQLFEVNASDQGPQAVFERIRTALESNGLATKDLTEMVGK